MTVRWGGFGQAGGKIRSWLPDLLGVRCPLSIKTEMASEQLAPRGERRAESYSLGVTVGTRRPFTVTWDGARRAGRKVPTWGSEPVGTRGGEVAPTGDL